MRGTPCRHLNGMRKEFPGDRSRILGRWRCPLGTLGRSSLPVRDGPSYGRYSFHDTPVYEGRAPRRDCPPNNNGPTVPMPMKPPASNVGCPLFRTAPCSYLPCPNPVYLCASEYGFLNVPFLAGASSTFPPKPVVLHDLPLLAGRSCARRAHLTSPALPSSIHDAGTLKPEQRQTSDAAFQHGAGR